MKFQGKTLLVLGSNVGSIDIVNYARSEGAHTIVADYLSDTKSPAKLIADEQWLISTIDTDTLLRRIKETPVDGILAGISEINLLSAMTLSQLLGLRFYCNIDQWNSIENKKNFRLLCSKFGVPVPKTYFVGQHISEEIYSRIEYPVIIKPVDSSSSIGVYICHTEKNLRESESLSLKESDSGQIIVEEYFRGEEFAAHYSILNGKVTLSSIDNRYPVAVNSGEVTTIPIARVYPSSFIDEYIKQVDRPMIDLVASLALSTGVLFVQGLYDKTKNRFVVFEAGLRSAGEAPYRFISRINGVNYMNNIVDYILLGRVDDSQNADNPFFNNRKCALVSFVSRGGKVGSISGYEETVNELDSIIDSECRYKEGDETPCGNTLRQIMLRFALLTESRERLKEEIRYINTHVDVRDDKGNELCLKFDETLL